MNGYQARKINEVQNVINKREFLDCFEFFFEDVAEEVLISEYIRIFF